MQPKISIIVPIYNTAKYLPACLDSIVNQTYQNLEVILVDDGSTDNSGVIANDYAKKDHRIKIIHQKNSGQSAARNAGLAKATGKYIGFVDSDDQITRLYQNTFRPLPSPIYLARYLRPRIPQHQKTHFQSPLHRTT